MDQRVIITQSFTKKAQRSLRFWYCFVHSMNLRMIIYGSARNYYTKFHKEGAKVTKVFEAVLYIENLAPEGQPVCNPGQRPGLQWQ